MPNRRFYLFALGLGIVVVLSLLVLWPITPASAQCGSQASSCKTCHETQGQDSVNADNTGWHTGHAFGDFCYSCHGGNNQSMVKEAAHMGMVPPMSDIKTACAGCHPDDLQDRALIYATALGITLGSGTFEPAGTPAAATPPAAGTSGEATESTAAPAPEMVVSSPEVIDYVARYTGENPINWGNVTVILLIVLIVLGGGAFVYWNERKLRGLPVFSLRASASPVKPAEQPKVPGYPDEVAALLPQLARLNPVGLHALKRILENPEQANEMLHSLSHLDPELVKRLRSLDKDSRALLLALAGD